MAALLAASALHSTVIEKLHFRHFWLALAMVCASALLPKRNPGGRETLSEARSQASMTRAVRSSLVPRASVAAAPTTTVCS